MPNSLLIEYEYEMQIHMFKMLTEKQVETCETIYIFKTVHNLKKH